MPEDHIRELIASIDSIVREQLTHILKDISLTKLISRWSALYYFIKSSNNPTIKIKIFNIKWTEVVNITSIGYSLDNILARKILDESELPGNAPLSLIIGDYDLDVSDRDTVKVLTHLAEICATAFSPFISTITPKVFDLESFAHLYKISLVDFHHTLGKYFTKLSELPESVFVGLVIPQILYPSLSNIYERNYCPILKSEIKNCSYVFGSPTYAYASIVTNSFINTGWFLDTIGMPPDNLSNQQEAGIVPLLRSQKFFGDECNIPFAFYKSLTQILISEKKEQEIAKLGLITICHVKNRDFAVVYNANSLRAMNNVGTEDIINLSYTLPYLLCVCRFAHYIKVIARQKIGLYNNVLELQDYLNNWLLQYISSNPNTALHLKYKYPLLAAKVEVIANNFLTDSFNCIIYLRPHLLTNQHPVEIVLSVKLLGVPT